MCTIVNTAGLVLLAGLSASGAAYAQEPKEGRIDWTLCFGGSTQLIGPTAQDPTPKDRFATYDVTGGIVVAAGPAPAMSVECLGAFELRGRAYQHRGYCVFQDPAGHRIHGNDNRDAQGYTWTFLGGTGKYEGISGSGTTEVIGSMTPVRPGTLQGCRRLQGQWKLP